MVKLMVIGRAGKDAVWKETKDGKTYVSFPLAANLFNGSDETLWYDAMVRTDNQGLVDLIKKGREVYLEGRPDSKVDEYNDKVSVRTTIWVDNKGITLIGKKID